MLIKSFRFFIVYFNTVKYLRLKQVFFRVYYFFGFHKIFNSFSSTSVNSINAIDEWSWTGGLFNAQSIYDDFSLCFLNRKGVFLGRESWNNNDYDKLWLYNLHYFDDLNSSNFLEREEIHIKLIERWIDENPAFVGNGWEPYPLSLRLVNWIKWMSKKNKINKDWLVSIMKQSDALHQQLEYHILGNHLFANGKALVFSGCFLAGGAADKYLDSGLKILDQEIPEQFLADGGHFELSPMYHCILLWDLLDLIHLSQLTKNAKLAKRVSAWSEYASRALTWLRTMIHPDGEVSFFNDSAIGIAASPTQLFSYAQSLGIFLDTSNSSPLFTLSDSGYSRVSMPRHTLLFDHAAVGPDYLPGHAHADTLSFEWSVDEQRVFVNSGTSIYGASAERLRQRQTAAHNTVIVDDQDSSEVWSGFRVARRAYATLEHCVEMNGSVRIVASHNGYQRLKNKITHRRIVQVSSEQLSLVDEIVGEAKSSVALFHIHPAVKSTQLTEMEVQLLLPNGIELIFCASAPCRLVQTTWHPHFGESVPSMKIEVPFHTAKLSSTITFV